MKKDVWRHLKHWNLTRTKFASDMPEPYLKQLLLNLLPEQMRAQCKKGSYLQGWDVAGYLELSKRRMQRDERRPACSFTIWPTYKRYQNTLRISICGHGRECAPEIQKRLENWNKCALRSTNRQRRADKRTDARGLPVAERRLLVEDVMPLRDAVVVHIRAAVEAHLLEADAAPSQGQTPDGKTARVGNVARQNIPGKCPQFIKPLKKNIGKIPREHRSTYQKDMAARAASGVSAVSGDDAASHAGTEDRDDDLVQALARVPRWGCSAITEAPVTVQNTFDVAGFVPDEADDVEEADVVAQLHEQPQSLPSLTTQPSPTTHPKKEICKDETTATIDTIQQQQQARRHRTHGREDQQDLCHGKSWQNRNGYQRWQITLADGFRFSSYHC